MFAAGVVGTLVTGLTGATGTLAAVATGLVGTVPASTASSSRSMTASESFPGTGPVPKKVFFGGGSISCC